MEAGSRQTPEPGEDRAPARAGSFEIVSLIGRGGMGCVYRARDTTLGREVAIKRPRPDLLEKPGFRRRFLREARAASQLLHPNLTTVFEVFEEDGVPWLAMELVEGCSLRSQLVGDKPLPAGEIVAHAEGLTDALHAAHRAGTLHRDINPNNILIGTDGRARLTDFGLARAFVDPNSSSKASTMTASSDFETSGGVVGTRGYMSPEQVLGQDLDPRSDLFSLGLVLYEMCTGRPAFPATDNGWLDALLHHEPPAISKQNYEIPEELERIVRKAMAKRPDERYQNAGDMLTDIRALRRKIESGTLTSPLPRRPGISRWRRPAVLAVLATVVAAAAVAAWIGLASRQGELAFTSWDPRQLTSEPGWEAEPALSPDGSLIAYASDESGNPDIWLIDVAGGSRIALTHDPAADAHPAWFPDGSAVAFVSDRSGENAIWRVPRLGGTPVLLMPNAVDPAISPDGTTLAFSNAGPTGLFRIGIASLDGAWDPVTLTSDDNGLWSHRDPAWSPDGRTICFADFRDLWLVDVADGAIHPLTRDHATDREPEWAHDGRSVFFSSGRGDAYALWQVPVAGGPPRRVTVGSGPEVQPTLSPDGTRIAYSTLSDTENVVILDRLGGRATRAPSRRSMSTPAVAPDGTSFTYPSDRAGKYDLWLQPLDDGRLNGPPHRLTDLPGSVETPDYSPDGLWVAFFRVVDKERDIWVVPASGGIPNQLTDNPGVDVHPDFSPDGTQIAFISDRGGHAQVWVVGFEKGRTIGQPRRVSNNAVAALFPTWSPEGSHIAYLSGGDVWMTEVSGGGSDRRLTDGAHAFQVHWENLGDRLLVSGTWGTDRMVLRQVSLDDDTPTEPPHPVNFGDSEAAGIFDADARGRLIVYIESHPRGDLWMLESVRGRQ